MKAIITPPIKPTRGGKVVEGNVYANSHGRYYKICIAVVNRQDCRPFNNVAFIHVNALGDVVGVSMQPEAYVSNHQDLVGTIIGPLPDLKIKWLRK